MTTYTTDDPETPEETGRVTSVGQPDKQSTADRRLRDIKSAIEVNGEVHLVLEDGREAEARLGPTRINYRTEQVQIHDGDKWRSFMVERVIDWYEPLDVIHNEAGT